MIRAGMGAGGLRWGGLWVTLKARQKGPDSSIGSHLRS